MTTSVRVVLLSAALFFVPAAFAQTDASVSGTVSDPSGAHVVAATVTALNTATGVAVPVTTNEAGVYTLPPLPPGKYTFSAEHPGFRKSVISDVNLQTGTVITLNMALELGQTTESVEVQAQATEVNATSASVGNVVDSKRLEELPLNGRSSYDLLLTQPGVVQGTNFYLNGAQGGAVNFTTDGVSTMDNLHQSQFYLYSNVASVDRVEEFRVVTSPADAEYGRGSGQVQMVTRAGGNRFNGSAFYEVRNAEFNANNFFNNLAGSKADGTPLEPRSQLKQNNYGVRFGGPVKRNKMFFNGIYEPYKQRNFTTVNETVLTPSALAGNFRFYPGALDGNAQAATPTVNLQGNPVQPSTATGPLQTVSVLGRDAAAPGFDPTGVMAHVLSYLPLPNNYLVGDGLNTAGFTWNYPTPVNFELYEGRIDYNFDDKERLAITLSQQSYHSFNVATPPPYPLVPGQADPTETTTYTAALTSVIRPNLLNEARMGIFRTRTIVEAPYQGSSEASKNLLPVIDGTPTLIYPALVNGDAISGPFGNLGIPGNYLNPTYQYGDNLTWIKGKHSFKGGVQFRFISLSGFDFSTPNLPEVILGNPPLQPITNISTGSNPIPGIGANANAATGLLEQLAGTVEAAQQLNLSPGGKTPVFLVGQSPFHNFHQNEFDWFFKDDWKITPSLTLNLGIRWELYLPPVEVQGKGAAPVGNSQALFGISGTSLDSLFNPFATGGSQSVVQGIGPGSANPGLQFYQTDYKNFAPALGLAWAVPGEGIWKLLSGGKDRMTIRMGYGIGYQRLPIGLINQNSGSEPGLSQETQTVTATNLSNVVVPVQPTGVPLAPVPLTGTGSHTQTLYAYDYDLRTPYTQNYNFTITRALGSAWTMDVAYVGSSSHQLVSTVNTNEVNIYENGILNAFNTVRAGGDSPLIDQIFSASRYGGAVATAGTGSKYVLTNSATQGFFANNNPGGFANYISTTNALSGSAGGLLTNAGLPLNFIVANPQFLNTDLTGNFGNSTYNSLQVQLNKRFAKGFSFQTSYVYSKVLGENEGDSATFAGNFRTLTNESLDKRPLSFDYQSVYKANGLYDLPFGKGKRFGANSNGLLDRIIGGWEIGGIFIAYSGQPITITAQNTINNTTALAGFTPQLLGSLPGDGVTKTGNGVIYFNGLTQILDPSIASLPASLQPLSTLRAIAGANGQPLLVNPLPGVMGALGNGVLFGPGGKQLNANVIKHIRINERFNFQIGATAENVTNTPIFANPQTSINSTAFGRITATAGLSGAGGSGGATASRLMVIQARLNF
jgi:hypothetical protein